MLMHPLVERVDDGVGQHDVVGGALLDEAREGGVHDALVDAQLIHELQARRRRLISGYDIHCLTDELAEVESFGVVAEEVILGTARPRHPLEGRVGDHVADVILDHELRPTVDLDVAHLALVLFRQILEQGLLGLVHVVVDVEDRIRQGPGRHEAEPSSEQRLSAFTPDENRRYHQR
jgi:hypothetical protein